MPGDFSVAASMRRARPRRLNPLNFSWAAAACSTVDISTKANPRGRPVSRSAGMVTLTTSPASAKRAWISSCVVSKSRLPTNSLV
jgi:hypothetical protein